MNGSCESSRSESSHTERMGGLRATTAAKMVSFFSHQYTTDNLKKSINCFEINKILSNRTRDFGGEMNFREYQTHFQYLGPVARNKRISIIFFG